MSPFLKHSGGFDPETLAILDVSFDATFKELQHNPYFDPVSARTPHSRPHYENRFSGASDPQKITALALAAFRSHCYGPSKRRTA